MSASNAVNTIAGIAASTNQSAYLYLEAPVVRGLSGAPELLMFEGVEAISNPFQFVLTLRCPAEWLERGGWFETLAGEWLGRPIGFGLARQEGADFHGVVCSVLEDSPGLIKVVVGPRLSLLQQSVTYRCIVNATADRAVSDVLERAGVSDVEWKLSGEARAVKDAYLQIGETDHDFISRVLAEAGMVYYFRHRRGGHTLVITDYTPALASEGVRQLTMRTGRPEPGAGPAVTSWRREMTLIPTRVVATGVAPTSPDVPWTVVSATAGSAAASHERVVEVGLVPGAARAEIERLASFVSDAISCGGERTHAASTMCLRAGEVVNQGGDGPRLIRVARHSAVEATPSRAGGYSCSVECLRASVPYRSPAPPPPARWGVFTAVVCDREGAIDEHPNRTVLDARGRAYIRFRWDRGQEAEPRAVPALLANAGSFASSTPPIVGQEVIVCFEHSAPDVPVITGPHPGRPSRLPHDPAKQAALHSFRIPASPGDDRRSDTMLQIDPDSASPEARVSLPGSLLANIARGVWAGVRKVFRLDVEETLALRGKKNVIIEGGELSFVCGSSSLVMSANGISLRSDRIYLNSAGGPAPASFPDAPPASSKG